MRTRAHLPSSHLIRDYFGAESSAQNCHLTDTQQHGRLPLTECLCSPKYTCSNRIPNAIVFGDGDLRRWLDHKGRALMEGIHALIKRPQRALTPSVKWRRSEKTAVYEPGSGYPPAPILDLGLPSLCNCEKLFSMVHNPPSFTPFFL